jgi:hypothetical protein
VATRLISFPPRLGPQGGFVVRDDDSNDYYAEELGVLLLVRPGERDLAPDFGTSDPVFDEVDQNEFAAKVATFGPPVDIVSVQTYPLGENRQDVTIRFEAADVEEAETREPISETEAAETEEPLNA